MKNHVRVDGRLLQTNKTWGHLKRKQQEWIYRVARERYSKQCHDQKTGHGL